MRASKQLYSLFLVFFIPALLGWLLFHFHNEFQFKTTNHGVLVNPAVHEDALAFDPAKQKFWQIVYAPASCGSDTEKKMYVLHQLRKALGKNQDRVSLTLLANSDCQQSAHDFRKLIFSKQQFAELQKSLNQNQVNDKIYLLDPIGNLFMYYSSASDPMDILKDLQNVLEVSQIG
jgi:hypothetical protein